MDAQIAAERQDKLIKLNSRNRVKPGRRLIEEEEIGLQHQSAGNAGPLFHATGNFAWQVFGKGTQSNEFEFRLYEFPYDRASQGRPCSQGKREILREGHRTEQRAGLK
jgi:hypothetical protein